MSKQDGLARELSPDAPRSAAQYPRSSLLKWLLKHSDLVFLLGFILASIDPVWFWPRMPTVVHDLGLADDSWHLDTVFKFSRGIRIGRDIAFTRGPIFQWLSCLPAHRVGVSLGATQATWDAVPVWCAFVSLCLTLRLLLPEQPAWKRALLLCLVIVFWLVWWEFSLQSTFSVLLFAIFLRGWYAVIERRTQSYFIGTVAALLTVMAFLIASDTGVYSAAAWMIATAAIFIEERGSKPVVRAGAIALFSYFVSALVYVLAVNAAMGRPFDFQFWKNSQQIVSAYRWATAAGMTHAGWVRLVGTMIGSAAVFVFRFATRNRQNCAITERIGFLIGGFALASLMLQTALVMSHLGHIQSACFPMALLAGVILFSFQSAPASCAAILLATVCSVLFSGPAFGPGTAMRLLRQWGHAEAGCPPGLREFDRGCFAPEFAAMLQSTSTYIGQHAGPRDSIVVFPYQTMFGIASRRNVSGGLMQPYAASGSFLAQLEITGLENARAPAGLYATDLEWSFQGERPGLSEPDEVRFHKLAMSRPILGIYNFTRTPEVWFWILRHYRSEGAELSPGILGLLRDNSRATRISIDPQSLGLPAQTFPIHERTSLLDLGMPHWPAGADFLRLRLTVHYSLWWKLRKPESMQLEITRVDGSTDLRSFIVQPNLSSEVWLYPWRQDELANYFNADESRWRSSPRPAITHLRILASPLDWISVTPSAIVLEGADAVQIHMSDIPTAEDRNP